MYSTTLASIGLEITPLGVLIGLLPVLTFVVIAIALAGCPKGGPGRVRESLLIAATAWGVWVVAGCEMLSLWRAVSFWPLLVWWLVPAVAAAGLLWRWRIAPHHLLRMPDRPGPGRLLLVSSAAGIILLAGLVAALSSPNTHDALTYHLPRQVRWLQQGSVEHFAIHNLNMIVLPPMAEFAGLLFMVVSGGDYYSTLVQWFAFALAAVAGSLIVRDLGGSAVAQTMAALLIATNPMIWLQASSAKNDIVAGLWVLILAFLVLRVLRRGHCAPIPAGLIGSAAGLALLTKPTAALFALPLLVILAGWLLFKERHRCIPAGMAIVTMVLALNAGHFARNMRMFDSPTAGETIRYLDRPHTNEIRNMRALASNAMRNIALHAGTPWPAVNRRSEGAVRRLHGLIDIDPDDDRTTIYAAFEVPYEPYNEDKAGAPAHVLFFVLAMGAFIPLVFMPRPKDPDADQNGIPACGRIGTLFIATLSAFFLFCFVLKWQPWHARLHIGIFMLAAPATAIVLCRQRCAGAIVIAGILCIILTPTALWNSSRPLVGSRNVWTSSRNSMTDRHHSGETNRKLAELVQKLEPEVVGINLHIDGEYAMIRRLLELEKPPLISQAMAPKGRRMPRPWPRPDLVLSDVHDMPSFRDTSTDSMLHLVHRMGDYRIYAALQAAERLAELELIPVPAVSAPP